MKFLMDSSGFICAIPGVDLRPAKARSVFKVISDRTIIFEGYKAAATETRAEDIMKNGKRGALFAPTWLKDLSPFIFLALTILGLIVALKTLPPALANSLYTYLAVFKI